MEEKQLNIELTEEIGEGVYSNLAFIAHAHTEFVIDFIKTMPNVPKAKVKARVILTPQHAKRFLRALAENVAKYEKQFGEIGSENTPPFPIHFNAPKGQA